MSPQPTGISNIQPPPNIQYRLSNKPSDMAEASSTSVQPAGGYQRHRDTEAGLAEEPTGPLPGQQGQPHVLQDPDNGPNDCNRLELIR